MSAPPDEMSRLLKIQTGMLERQGKDLQEAELKVVGMRAQIETLKAQVQLNSLLQLEIDKLKMQVQSLQARRLTLQDKYRDDYADLFDYDYNASRAELVTMRSLTGYPEGHSAVMHMLCGFRKSAESPGHPACGNRFCIDWRVMYEVAVDLIHCASDAE